MTNKVQERNYISIQGWMVSELKLKGNELIIYAIIYGFSQTEGQLFTGSLQYLADWTNSTKQGVSKNLKSLVEKGYIGKNDKYINQVKFCEYYTTKFNRVCNKVEQSMQQSLIPPMQQSLTNNIDLDNIEDNINSEIDEKKILTSKDTYAIPIIINYMNTCGEYENFKIKKTFNFSPKASSNKKYIVARLNENTYSINDFKDVIYNAYKKFVENEFKGLRGKSSVLYYRPSTLFSSKNFENYKNEYQNM